MCIILYHPNGAELPSKDDLENCWDQNSDGAGLVVDKGGVARIHKGFMTWEKFWAGYNNERLKKDDAFAVQKGIKDTDKLFSLMTSA